jgi:ribosomal protein L29
MVSKPSMRVRAMRIRPARKVIARMGGIVREEERDR